MDRNKAMEKARACLAIANDKGAYPEEKKNALEMAQKLADKYGFKIDKAKPTTSTTNLYTGFNSSHNDPAWVVDFKGNVRTDMVNLIANILKNEGFTGIFATFGKGSNGKNYYTIRYRYKKEIGDQIQKLYRDLNKLCKDWRKVTGLSTTDFVQSVFRYYILKKNGSEVEPGMYSLAAYRAIEEFRGQLG